jgi:hypothetical protein
VTLQQQARVPDLINVHWCTADEQLQQYTIVPGTLRVGDTFSRLGHTLRITSATKSARWLCVLDLVVEVVTSDDKAYTAPTTIGDMAR